MLSKMMMLYPSVPEETLALCIENAQAFILDYCNLEEYPHSMDTLLLKMAQEDVNKLFSEGFASESTGGNSVSYNQDYSPQIYKRLNKHKLIRTVR